MSRGAVGRKARWSDRATEAGICEVNLSKGLQKEQKHSNNGNCPQGPQTES